MTIKIPLGLILMCLQPFPVQNNFRWQFLSELSPLCTGVDNLKNLISYSLSRGIEWRVRSDRDGLHYKICAFDHKGCCLSCAYYKNHWERWLFAKSQFLKAHVITCSCLGDLVSPFSFCNIQRSEIPALSYW